ncbi:pantoate--beta-alanine ligase [Geotalea daltonii FRC-32]|uniref:Pantothenate synthetase n=1 Tax=Geotalea daltonii (strain DSM 22248 / JCM 15807 / FRC-32) TaxID=316067 RepID=PANC_GEODF|nr:pantoate--beta-alanine ligase [Geotalea daltonii]B9M2A2.1 RecName: Full=Pantothenate synthetase; Short=PS; AltName: Full=Pantoate--beta-alanine ligase; AltName: Full=Pantoate-activating enzyme [Geotalea daltonii FRC-32]ACM21220.1 pantoate--beta-alanine ligase [Geotalea daltonii FRC-32]
MELIQCIDEMQSIAQAARANGKRIALVPTMGYLHQGHASLMVEGQKRADLLVASIFVNPTQFGVGEDFDSYPRDMENDMRIAEAAGVDLIFAPRAADMYPADYQTYVNVEELTLPLCGANRPGHFRGVTTVVAKFFNIVSPHVALFGQKDYQQLAVIRQMVADLNMPVEVIGMPIVREADGLAMSSRNSYLSPAERVSALCLSNSLNAVRTAFCKGERSVAALKNLVLDMISKERCAAIDYVEFRHGLNLAAVDTADEQTVVALAVKIGKTRLIDNRVLGEE